MQHRIVSTVPRNSRGWPKGPLVKIHVVRGKLEIQFCQERLWQARWFLYRGLWWRQVGGFPGAVLSRKQRHRMRKGHFLQKENDQTLVAVSPDGSRLVLVVLNNTDEVVTKRYQLPKKISKVELYITSETQNLEKEVLSLNSAELLVTLAPHSVRTYIFNI